MAITFLNSLAVDTDVLYVDAINDRVGIGTTSPSYDLHVNGTTYSNTTRSGRYYGTSGTSSYLDLDSGAPYALLASSEVNITNDIIGNYLEATEPDGIAATSGPVRGTRFYTYGNTTYFVDPADSTTSAILNGKVGIGTTSPSFPLEVDGGTGDGVKIKAGNTSNDDSFLIANSSDTTLFVVDGGGNVGIGTSSPACGLDISNAGNGSVGEQVRITSTDTEAKLAFVNTGGNGAITQSSGAMRFMTNTANIERMRIGPAGQIGIGGANYGTSGQVLTSNGSGSAPSWQDASGSSNWTLSGNDIYNNNSGNVGIGTSSPSNTTHIYKNATIGSITSTNVANAGLRIQDSGASMYMDGNSIVLTNNSYITTNSDTYFALGTNNQTRIHITGAGLVGIGTTSPSSTLTIKSTTGSGAGANVSLHRGADRASHQNYLVWQSDSYSDEIYIGTPVNSSTATIGARQGDINFQTGAYVDRMRITSGGNVGIGTSSPTTGKLVVHSGDIEVRDSTGNSGGRIKSYDDHHAIYFREGANNQINYYEYGGNVSAGGGHRFFTGGTKPNQTLKLQIGDDYTQINNSTRSPIFYDSNNTSYYADPGATSQFNGLTVTNTINGSISGANAVNITGYGNGNFTFNQLSGSFNVFSGWHNYFIGNHGNGSNYYNTIIAMPFWGSPRYSRLEGGTQRGPFEFWTSEIAINSSQNITAPIYYDYNNTGYYVDPASTSNLNFLTVNGVNSPLQVNGASGNDAVLILKDGNTFNYIGSEIQFQSNNGSTGARIEYLSNPGASEMRIYTEGSSTNSARFKTQATYFNNQVHATQFVGQTYVITGSVDHTSSNTYAYWYYNWHQSTSASTSAYAEHFFVAPFDGYIGKFYHRGVGIDNSNITNITLIAEINGAYNNLGNGTLSGSGSNKIFKWTNTNQSLYDFNEGDRIAMKYNVNSIFGETCFAVELVRKTT